MKHLVIVLTTLFLYSCNLDNKSVDKKEFTIDTIQKIKTDSLIGEWGIYATISDGVEVNCNVCPKITFNSDQTAMLIIPSGDKGKLKWTANNKKLTLTTVHKSNVERIFPDSLYEMTLTKEKGVIELELKQSEKKYSKILRR